MKSSSWGYLGFVCVCIYKKIYNHVYKLTKCKNCLCWQNLTHYKTCFRSIRCYIFDSFSSSVENIALYLLNKEIAYCDVLFINQWHVVCDIRPCAKETKSIGYDPCPRYKWFGICRLSVIISQNALESCLD